MSEVKSLAELTASKDRESGEGRLSAAATRAWADGGRRRRWTVWARLSWAWDVSEMRASQQVEQWAERLRARVPGAAVLVGLHNDTARRHAHAVIFVPRQWSAPPFPLGVHVVGECWGLWLAWPHGDIWAERFSPGPTASAHGAVAYLARDPGTVLSFGRAPAYQPRRPRDRK
jgi:hypothetical protein